jgi:hypothetical protein
VPFATLTNENNPNNPNKPTLVGFILTMAVTYKLNFAAK